MAVIDDVRLGGDTRFGGGKIDTITPALWRYLVLFEQIRMP